MKPLSFKNFLQEDDTKAIVKTGINSMKIDSSLTKEIVNQRLQQATNHEFLTPYIALGSISRVLAYVGIIVPQYTFLDRREGEVVFDAAQFGHVQGVNIDGTPSIPETEYFVYFSYTMNDHGYYDCFAALVDIEELHLMMDMDEEDEDVDKVHNAQKLGEEKKELDNPVNKFGEKETDDEEKQVQKDVKSVEKIQDKLEKDDNTKAAKLPVKRKVDEQIKAESPFKNDPKNPLSKAGFSIDKGVTGLIRKLVFGKQKAQKVERDNPVVPKSMGRPRP